MTTVLTKDKNYVIFHSPGTFFDEKSSRPIESWDLKKAIKLSKEIDERYGAKPYGFSFVTYREADPVKDKNGNELKVEPKRIAWSPGTVYLGGIVETYDEVMKRNDPEEEILRNNMSGGMWTIITNTNSYKTVRPFKLDDVIVDESGTITARGEDYKEYHEEKEIDFLANKICDILLVNPNSVNLGQVSKGWLADVLYNGSTLEGVVKDDPIEAMKSLLEKAQHQKKS